MHKINKIENLVFVHKITMRWNVQAFKSFDLEEMKKNLLCAQLNIKIIKCMDLKLLFELFVLGIGVNWW